VSVNLETLGWLRKGQRLDRRVSALEADQQRRDEHARVPFRETITLAADLSQAAPGLERYCREASMGGRGDAVSRMGPQDEVTIATGRGTVGLAGCGGMKAG
jgi:hypothetical protein